MRLEVLGAAVLLVAFVIAAAIARVLVIARRDPPRHTNPNLSEYFSDANFPLVADRELGVWNRANHHFVKHTETTIGNLTTHVWFDRYGVRVPGPQFTTPESVDIIVVGESNTWGQGTPAESTYAAVLGDLLGMTSANCGLIASNGVQDLLIVRRFLRHRPKLVVYGLWEEHFAANLSRCTNIDSPICLGRPVVRGTGLQDFRVSLPRLTGLALKDYRAWYLQTSPAARRSIWLDGYWTARVLLREWTRKHFRAANREPEPWRRLAARPEWPVVLGASWFVISEMKRLADSVGARLVVAYLPYYFDRNIAPPPPELAVLARDAGISLVSLHALWSARNRDGTRFTYEGEGHLDLQGHRDVAEAVAAVLRASGFQTPAAAGSAKRA